MLNYSKYLKYKNKYLSLKKQIGSGGNLSSCISRYIKLDIS